MALQSQGPQVQVSGRQCEGHNLRGYEWGAAGKWPDIGVDVQTGGNAGVGVGHSVHQYSYTGFRADHVDIVVGGTHPLQIAGKQATYEQNRLSVGAIDLINDL